MNEKKKKKRSKWRREKGKMLYILVGENESMGKFICSARSAYVVARVIGVGWKKCYRSSFGFTVIIFKLTLGREKILGRRYYCGENFSIE